MFLFFIFINQILQCCQLDILVSHSVATFSVASFQCCQLKILMIHTVLPTALSYSVANSTQHIFTVLSSLKLKKTLKNIAKSTLQFLAYWQGALLRKSFDPLLICDQIRTTLAPVRSLSRGRDRRGDNQPQKQVGAVFWQSIESWRKGHENSMRRPPSQHMWTGTKGYAITHSTGCLYPRHLATFMLCYELSWDRLPPACRGFLSRSSPADVFSCGLLPRAIFLSDQFPLPTASLSKQKDHRSEVDGPWITSR